MIFNCNDPLILENEHVLLRPLEESDIENLLEIAINEPETWKYSLVSAHGKENLTQYIQKAIEARINNTELPFIVYDKKSKKYAGSTRFYDIRMDFKTLLLGYTWYGKNYRGTGLNKHCKLLLLQFAFETLGVKRVEFRADTNNALSIAAMKSIGCTVEGILRSHLPVELGQQKRRDSIILSILSEEWFDHVKENLKNKL